MYDPRCRLVRFEAADGFQVDAMLAWADADTTVIHVHGICGNFYTNPFVSEMNRQYPSQGMNFLAINHRGHDVIAEGYINGDLTYVGGALEQFEETLRDVEAAIEFASEFSDLIILQGHSGGCEKVLAYAAKWATNPPPVILIGPADSKELLRQYIEPESLIDQHRRLRRYTEDDDWFSLLPESEFGISTEGAEYPVPKTKNSLLGLHDSGALEILDYKTSWPDDPIQTSGLACLGGEDPLLTTPIPKIRDALSDRLKTLSVYKSDSADHHFSGEERPLVAAITDWVKELENESLS